METSAPRIHTAPARTILSVSGPEARALLQRVITADVETLEPGQCRPGALLTPQGKLAVDFLLFADGETVWLDVPNAPAEALAKRLSMFKLRAKAEIVINTDLAALWSEHPFEGSAEDPRFGGTVYGGIGWKKGCFIGQEVVSRMKRRGTIRKRSLSLSFSGDAPARGTPVLAGTSTIGEITSSHGHDAIALIRLDRLEATSEAPQADGQTCRIDVPENLRPDAPAGKV